jgi:protein involved in temperature-dependent protein secretion
LNTTALYIGYGIIAETADVLVTKNGELGETEWFRSSDSSGSEFGHRIVFTSDGEFAFTGWTTVNE